ncbi:hypothetical protein NsoK4_07880 [Nitrosopumilus sp. K4]|uniref:CFI-box-CTERM domain-containing protein n=1 Tax=Nitrosopumilus sp. K4 TaxID=2795383 RepID=UPI001BAA2638|nr:CFI-box-CTERM domain-containing protein [Nitrosopumilus sp. K4]QUC64337.1 hypothetical protein NsoK4_07880 [Nitrosopumilus sp. K4]
MKYLAILLPVLLFGTVYAETPFFANGGLTKNGIEWCEENYQLYQFMGNDFFEHHQHSIESRVCVSLYNDPLWIYSEPDRYERLIEQSRMYTEFEIEESKQEAQTGIIDTKPVVIKEIPQEVAQQQKELEEKEESDTSEVEKSINEEPQNKNSKEGGGCLIATATYGSEMAPQVQLLREIRDSKVMSTESGASFMAGFNQFYYSFSPYVADYERENPVFKEMIRIGITPMLSTLSIMSMADSEQEILGYGIAVIMMNVGMYVAAPAMIVLKIKKGKKRVSCFCLFHHRVQE